MKFQGLNVNGYGTMGKGNDTHGMQVCGLFDIGALSYAQLGSGSENDLLITLQNSFGYGPAANILFAVSSTQLKAPSRTFLKMLLTHKNTRILYAYKNDAHGPSCIYICINHKNVPKNWQGNNIEEYKKKGKWSNYEHEVE